MQPRGRGGGALGQGAQPDAHPQRAGHRGERMARAAQEEAAAPPPGSWESRAAAYRSTVAQDKELIAIFERTYGPIKRDPLQAVRPAKKRPVAKSGAFKGALPSPRKRAPSTCWWTATT